MEEETVIKSSSITLFFLKNHLPNIVEVSFNSDEKDGDSWIIYPIIEGKTAFHYYIQLPKKINGYDRILVSNRSAEYLKQYPERINRLRIRFYPWPEIILPYKDNYNLYDEVDSIDFVMTRYDIRNGYIYEKDVPSYTKLIFNGFKRNGNFNKIYGPVKEWYFYDPENQY